MSIAPLAANSSSPFAVLANQQGSGASSVAKPMTEKDEAQGAHQAAVDDFLRWAKMNPIERVRAQYLESQNLTEEELAALPESERQKIEDAIQKEIERVLNDKAKQKALGNITIDV